MNRSKIMVVEDEWIVSDQICRYLKDFGYTVCGTASTGEEAIKKAKTERPDLVLMDANIPGLDGYGALEPHLSAETQRAVEPAKRFGFLILVVLLLAPSLNSWFFSVVFWFFDLSGVSSALASIGGQLTRFWSAWM